MNYNSIVINNPNFLIDSERSAYKDAWKDWNSADNAADARSYANDFFNKRANDKAADLDKLTKRLALLILERKAGMMPAKPVLTLAQMKLQPNQKPATYRYGGLTTQDVL